MTQDLLVIGLVVFTGAALQAAFGIGLGLLAAPALALVDHSFLPGPLLFSTTCLSFLVLLRERRGVDLKGLPWAFVGRVPGTFVGAMVVTLAAGAWLDLTLGAMILGCVLMSRSRFHLEPNRPTLLAAGFVSGITGTAVSVGGPPIALVYQRRTGEEIRATMGGYFIVGTTFSLLVLAGMGRFGVPELRLAGLLLPFVLLGFAVSGRLSRWGGDAVVRPVILGLSGSAALVVFVRGLWLLGA